LLIAAGPARANAWWLQRLLDWPLLVRLGDVSYSWYLWHWPAIVFGRTLFPTVGWLPCLLAIVSLVPAWLSYVAVERPIRSWRPRAGWPTTLLALGCVCLPLLAAGILAGVVQALADVPSITSYSTGTRFHLDVTDGCDSTAPLGSRASRCAWPVPGSLGDIVLVGDSNAGHYAEPVIAAGHSLKRSVTLATLSGCPFVDVRGRRDGVEQAACRNFVEKSMSVLLANPPELVLLASASDAYIQGAAWELSAPTSRDWIGSVDDKADLWTRRLEVMLRSLAQAGTEVILVHPLPRLGSWRARSCAVGVVAFRPEACAPSRRLEDANVDRIQALKAETVSAQATGTYTIDLAPEVCPSSTCRAWRDGIWWYRDGWHLGVDGALALTPQFRQAMTDALSRR
jgi:hypothetical protein